MYLKIGTAGGEYNLMCLECFRLGAEADIAEGARLTQCVHHIESLLRVFEYRELHTAIQRTFLTELLRPVAASTGVARVVVLTHGGSQRDCLLLFVTSV